MEFLLHDLAFVIQGARWPDGSFSIVDADDETHARIQLDELGEEPAELWPMQSHLLDFDLNDEGTIRLKQFGEQTGPKILARAYPVLNKTLEGEAFTEHAIEQQAEPQEYDSTATRVPPQGCAGRAQAPRSFRRPSATN